MIGLLIITNSYDVTTDLLLNKLSRDCVFRLNFDQILEYKIRFANEGFVISDPTGRSVNSETIKKAYWRKPCNAEANTDEVLGQYVASEMKYVLSELINFLWSERKLVLVEPYAEHRTGKLLQLRQALGLFVVPAYEFLLNQSSSLFPVVVKSLSSEPVGDNVLYTTVARTDDLDPTFPWFVEELVAGNHDVTVVFVRGQMFGFSLARDFLEKSVDWRQFISPNQRWRSHTIPADLQEAITLFMAKLRLDFGRLDFLLDENDQYWFCEVNPNGQFAWLDLNDEFGLLRAVITEICPTTDARPIPNYHPLDAASVC